MKNKNKKIQVLNQDLIKYSRQIGIIDIEIPDLFFYGEDYTIKENKTLARLGYKQYTRTYKSTKMYGYCSLLSRTIFVNIRGKRTLRELRNTLIHELCHYKFNGISHKEIDKRIKLIMQGKTYSKKHIRVPKFGFA